MNPPSVSIVVLNWNGADDTLACLDSLATLTYSSFNVVVVDNGSTDDSLAHLRTYKAPYLLALLETGITWVLRGVITSARGMRWNTARTSFWY